MSRDIGRKISVADAVVIGGGMVGAAIAWGLQRAGQSVVVLDGADDAHRAARGNFGLVWVQSKGDGMPEYAGWSRMAASIWPDLAAELEDETGISAGFFAPGGLHLCMSEEELEARATLLKRMHNVVTDYPFEARLIDRQEAEEMTPGLGPEVRGASYCAQDGHASPQGLLQALHRAILQRGGTILSGIRADRIERDGGAWRVSGSGASAAGERVVLAAGLANAELGPLAGLEVPVFPRKGQILVTERMGPRLAYPTHKIRQTTDGTMLLGDSQEPEAGYDDRATSPVIADIARRALAMYPYLAEANLVRAWAGLRTMTPDGFPVYEESASHPGIFVANCHSGVTLAGAHALRLAPMIAAGRLAPEAAVFSTRRFDVQAR